MARYSQIIGPAADFSVGGGFGTIPGFTITRFWDDGELLILAGAWYSRGAALGRTWELRAMVDALQQNHLWLAQFAENGQSSSISLSGIVPITQGLHTISLEASGDAAANDFIVAQGTHLTVIQLPLWDDTTGLITL